MSDSRIIIKAKTPLFDLKLDELVEYKDLIWLFFKRNYSIRYKQTILGPAWLVISPLFTIFAYTILFGRLAGLSTDGIPQPLFYLSGTIFWNFFSECFSGTANTFTGNAGIFGKVYFPRLTIPVSNLLTCLADFIIRFIMLLIFIAYYALNNYGVFISWKIIMLPLLILQEALLAMSVGIIVSSVTTKYRDLQVLVGFGLQLWMYATPVIYSTSIVPDSWKEIFLLNPVTPSLLLFKNALFCTESFDFKYAIYASCTTLILLFAGIVIFNRVEKTFMDTV